MLLHSNIRFAWEIHTRLGEMDCLDRPSIQSQATEGLVQDVGAAVPEFLQTKTCEQSPIDGSTSLGKNAAPLCSKVVCFVPLSTVSFVSVRSY